MYGSCPIHVDHFSVINIVLLQESWQVPAATIIYAVWFSKNLQYRPASQLSLTFIKLTELYGSSMWQAASMLSRYTYALVIARSLIYIMQSVINTSDFDSVFTAIS